MSDKEGGGDTEDMVQNLQDAVRVLRRHRCGLMDHLHQSQSRVDCLNYLVYKMEKEMKTKEHGQK